MRKRVLIVGGGTAGWLTAGYLAAMPSHEQFIARHCAAAVS